MPANGAGQRMSRIKLRGTPQPPGAHWDGHGVNFALFSAHAERVELCLFDADWRREIERIELEASARCGTPTCPAAARARLRLPRVRPLPTQQGHRFNPNKLLLDPYARSLQGALTWDDSVYGYTPGDDDAGSQFRHARQCRLRAQVSRRRRILRLARRSAAATSLGAHDHL